MLILIGAFVVLASMLGGFVIAGGNPLVLLHISEFVIIFGIAGGLLIIASPSHVLKDVLAKCKEAVTGSTPKQSDYEDVFKALYELFMLGRRNGLIALEEHVTNPADSSILKKYPVLTSHEERLEFLLNSLRPIVDGRIKPDQLGVLLQAELDAKEEEAQHPVHILQLVGDSLPGIGIVAAVLGIINTMAAIADGPEAVGQKVAAALTGTFLGIFAAYGFVNPLANRVKMNIASDMQILRCIMQAVESFAHGMAPLTAVEIARRSLESSIQPNADALEKMLKSLNS